jgi:hypothetical protein
VSLTYRNFDRSSGREIDLHDWLTDAGVERQRVEGTGDELKMLRPALRDAVLAGWRAEDEDCAGVVRNEAFWSIGLTRTGFIFTPQLAHVVQACGDSFRVPFARLAPFLSLQAADDLRALHAERAPR